MRAMESSNSWISLSGSSLNGTLINSASPFMVRLSGGAFTAIIMAKAHMRSRPLFSQ